MNRCKSLSAFLFVALASAALTGDIFAQRRQRVISNSPPAATAPQEQSAHVQSKAEPLDLQEDYQKPKPTLTNNVVVNQNYQPLVKKTVSSQPIASPTTANNYASRYSYSAMFSTRLLNAIQTKIGKPYVYGSSGPNSYDCSGLIWRVFGEAGYSFERTSARSIWQMSEPAEGDDRYKVGTLIFFNSLGHIGIVADANGFYHASSSKGVMYSRFDGYWKNKIVGFRRMKIANQTAQLK